MTAPDSIDGMSPAKKQERPASALAVTVSIIGRCEIVLGRVRVRPDSAVLFALLLYLTLRAGTRITRDELLELLWPEVADRSRRHSLRQLLYRVRQAGVPLDVDGPEITIDAQAVATDIGRLFEPGWASTVQVDDIPSPRTILPMYRPGVGAAFDGWLDGVRDEAAAQIRRASLRHIELGRREGRWEDVEAVARICLTCDPLNEDATRALAEATAMAGAQAEALRILDAYLWEIGGQTGSVGHDVKLLRHRIASQPQFHRQQAGEPPLIGRSADLVWLNGRRDAVNAATPGSAMLLGPPGIGKTAIVRAFTGYAEMRGWQVAVARLQPTDGDRPMSVFLELLPHLLTAAGALGAAPESFAQLKRLLGLHVEEDGILAGLSQEPEAVQARIRAAALDLLGAVAHEAPLIVVLEDLHWVDMSSLRLLAWLVEHAAALPVFWLLTSRMESRFPQLREVFPADRVPARTVGPLNADESAELFTAFVPTARRDPRIAELAFAATGGNPLFIREVAGHWTDTGEPKLPANLRSLMTERVARLSPGSQRMLQCCAMLGRFATVPRVAAALEVSTVALLEAVEELDGLGLLGVGGTPGSLALHDLWQEQVISTMKPSALALLHLRCGEVLQAESLTDRSAALVVDAARHLTAAGANSRAIRLVCDAAEHQLANGLTDDAVATSRHGCSIATEPADIARSKSLHLRALHQAGRWAEILSVGPAIVRNASSDARVPHDDAELLCIEALWRTGSSPQFAAERALECAEDAAAPGEHRLKACVIVAQAASNLFDAPLLKRGREAADRLQRTTADMRAVGLLFDIIYETEMGSVATAISLSSTLVETQRHNGNPGGLTRALRFACYPHRAVGDRELALALSVEAHDVAARHQMAEQAAHAADICATIELDRANDATAEAWIHRAEVWANRVSLNYLKRGRALLRAAIAIERGALTAAAQCLDDMAQGDAPMTARENLETLSLRCRLLIAQGRLSELSEPSAQLGAALERSRCFFLQDAYVTAYVAALRAQDGEELAAAYAARYRDEWRRDTSQLPEELAALAANQP